MDAYGPWVIRGLTGRLSYHSTFACSICTCCSSWATWVAHSRGVRSGIAVIKTTAPSTRKIPGLRSKFSCSDDSPRAQGPMRLRLIERETVQQPLELARRDRLSRGSPSGGPLDAPAFEPSVMQPLCRKIGYAEILWSILVKARPPGALGTDRPGDFGITGRRNPQGHLNFTPCPNHVDPRHRGQRSEIPDPHGSGSPWFLLTTGPQTCSSYGLPFPKGLGVAYHL